MSTFTMTQMLLLALANTVCKMEGGWFGECKFRQPIVTGFVAGLILGNITDGLKYGAEFEILYMGTAGIGPVAHLDVTTGGTIGTAVAIATGKGVDFAMLFALPISVVMQFVEAITQSAFTVFNSLIDKAIADQQWKKIDAWMFIGAGLMVLSNFVVTFVILNASNALSTAMDVALPEWIQNGLSGAACVLASTGFAMLLSIMMDTELVPFFMIGFILAAFGGAPNTMIGIGGIGLALALIMNLILTKCGGGAKDEWED